ncbi:MAG: hypothetical protein ABFD25_00850 [Clostridiaceae bacterium]
MHKKNGPARPLGSIDKCERCGKDYVVEGGLQRFCPECQPIHAQEYDRETGLEFYHENKDRINPYRNENRRKDPVKCKWCGKIFAPGTRSNTCSPECERLYKNKQWRKWYHGPNCVVCGKKAEVGRKTCSAECLKILQKRDYKPYSKYKDKLDKARIPAHAKAWTIMSPSGEIYRPYNLKQWVRDNINLFYGTPNQVIVGFYSINFGSLRRWKGWKLLGCMKMDNKMKICTVCNQWYVGDKCER